jgi:hypothetical protein
MQGMRACRDAQALQVMLYSIIQFDAATSGFSSRSKGKARCTIAAAAAAAASAAAAHGVLAQGSSRALAGQIIVRRRWRKPANWSQSRYNTQVQQPLLEDAWKHLKVPWLLRYSLPVVMAAPDDDSSSSILNKSWWIVSKKSEAPWYML